MQKNSKNAVIDYTTCAANDFYKANHFAYTPKLFCVCPQGVLRMPARCFAYARKVVTSLLRPCYKGSCTWRAALQSLYSPLTKREVAPQVPA